MHHPGVLPPYFKSTTCCNKPHNFYGDTRFFHRFYTKNKIKWVYIFIGLLSKSAYYTVERIPTGIIDTGKEFCPLPTTPHCTDRFIVQTCPL